MKKNSLKKKRTYNGPYFFKSKLTKGENVVILKARKNMRTSEKQELKRKIKQIGLFLLIVFLPCMVVCVCLLALKVPQWLNIMVLVIMMFLMFALYAYVMERLNRKKQERISKKKDPFSD